MSCFVWCQASHRRRGWNPSYSLLDAFKNKSFGGMGRFRRWRNTVLQSRVQKNPNYLNSEQRSYVVVLKSDNSILITGILDSWPGPHPPALVTTQRLMLSLYLSNPHRCPKLDCKARAFLARVKWIFASIYKYSENVSCLASAGWLMRYKILGDATLWTSERFKFKFTYIYSMVRAMWKADGMNILQ